METSVVIVDDDPIVLKRAWSVLNDEGIKSVVIKSGAQLFEYLDNNPAPNLILLDIRMPDMDGFAVLKELRKRQKGINEIPVIFLTAEEDEETETKGLLLGAMDFIRKPFIPSILVLRVKNAIELVSLQRDLNREVKLKTYENEQLFIQVVSSLAAAIDAKDTYTNGHSGRVAEYSKEIARRYGYNESKQDSIYMMGLLHDVGKIGVPDAVINKPDRLTDEEFALIKVHPEIGGRILENIKNMPELSMGARWHHERYDGTGYPDGLKGEDIPEQARIIAIADAYDAMTSNRSYRKYMPQDKVRAEIERCKGSQFDPVFADILLEMIDDDKDYLMREIKDE